MGYRRTRASRQRYVKAMLKAEQERDEKQKVKSDKKQRVLRIDCESRAQLRNILGAKATGFIEEDVCEGLKRLVNRFESPSLRQQAIAIVSQTLQASGRPEGIEQPPPSAAVPRITAGSASSGAGEGRRKRGREEMEEEDEELGENGENGELVEPPPAKKQRRRRAFRRLFKKPTKSRVRREKKIERKKRRLKEKALGLPKV
eukprot:RCo047701